jgi:hypothetical protein
MNDDQNSRLKSGPRGFTDTINAIFLICHPAFDLFLVFDRTLARVLHSTENPHFSRKGRARNGAPISAIDVLRAHF